MFLFNKKEITRLDSAIKNSFINVKSDIQNISYSVDITNQNIQNIYAWIEHLQHENHILSDEISEIHKILKLSPNTKEEIKRIVDYYYSFEDIINKVHTLDDSITFLTNKFKQISNIKDFDIASQLQYLAEIKELKIKIDEIEKNAIKRPSTREKLIKKITVKSREYVRNLIISYIQKYEKISALKLREMIVEEQGLASKSAFYRLLDEIERYDEVEVIKDGKAKYYFFKLIAHP
ncbi:MAG: hypothetical protein ABII01_02335 [Candidatus Woesearchaeota archaeon]